MPNARSVSKQKATPQQPIQMKKRTERPEPKVQPAPRNGVMFSGTQETIADAVADMLVSGSTEMNLTRLIHATISHDYRQKFSTFNEEKLNSAITQIQDRQTDEMLNDLATFKIKRVELKESERPEPKDIMERVRQMARHQCAVELRDFLESGNPEDIRLMHAIMVNYGCAHAEFLSSKSYGEASLAASFMDEIDQRNTYVRVPIGMLEDVTKYIDALWKITPTEAA